VIGREALLDAENKTTVREIVCVRKPGVVTDNESDLLVE
jgi:hypothetical protein